MASSGYPEEAARSGYPPEAVVGFIQKPYTVFALAEKVGEVLGSSPGQGSQIIEFPTTR